MKISSRKKKILKKLIENHIASGQTIASGQLAKSFGLSSATIRKELSDLEKSGYVFQPHISAGRLPTDKGYYYYVDNFVAVKEVVKNQIVENLKKSHLSEYLTDVELKNLAKKISQMTGMSVVVAFSANDFYLTGLSKIISLPDVALQISKAFDNLDQIVHNTYNQLEAGIEIYFGENLQISKECAIVAAKFNQNQNMLMIIGPLRMDYQKNVDILTFVKSLI